MTVKFPLLKVANDTFNLFLDSKATAQVNWCSSVVPFCSAKHIYKGKINSLRSPLYISFTFLVVCAPVGAHHQPFTCFASHTLSFLTRSYSIPPNPNKVFVKLTAFLIGGLSLLIFCARLLVASGWSGCHVFCSFPCAFSSFIFLIHASFVQFSRFQHHTQEQIQSLIFTLFNAIFFAIR